MKMRLTPFVTAQGAWLIAGRSAAGAVLLAVTVSACTGSGSSVPTIFTPGTSASGHPSSNGTRTPAPSDQATRSAGSASPSGSGSAAAPSSVHGASSAPATPSRTPTAQVTTEFPATPAPTHTAAYPTAAPQTGGGGTAGLQDGVLFGAGGLAVLAGFGTLAYRRRLARRFASGRPAADDRPPCDQAPCDQAPCDQPPRDGANR